MCTLLNLAYNYVDANGNNNGEIQSITDSRGAAFSTNYSYDGLGRLIQAQTQDLMAANTWNIVWQYDRYGNRISQSAGTPPGTLTTGQPAMTFDDTKNQFPLSSGFTYDPAGNVTKDPVPHAYTYNAEGELIAVDGADFYSYDGHRWKMQQTVSGATTTYIYSGSHVLAEYPAGAAPNAPSKEYIYAGGRLLATTAGGATTYQYPDQLSTRVKTDSAGNVTRTFGHLPFGEVWYETGDASKWKFTSYERDTAEPQLDYAMNRFYAYGFGRFQSPDPYMGSMDPTNPQSMNRYAYVLNVPTNLTDPLGLNPPFRPQYVPAPNPCVPPGCAMFGNDIFDALNGAPGTYLTFDMFGNIGFGFSPELWQLDESLNEMLNQRPTGPGWHAPGTGDTDLRAAGCLVNGDDVWCPPGANSDRTILFGVSDGAPAGPSNSSGNDSVLYPGDAGALQFQKY